MISRCRIAIDRTSVGVWLATVCFAVVLAPRSAEAATPGETLLQATPLILKDGRIAEVSVHVVPFQAGGAEVLPPAASELAELSREVATDCFLTAQVIGHVGPTEVAENDSLAAHRLARSRADAVQASLIGSGLPAKSIASVWDRQFMVPEPRATLWMFRLTEGEDCDGTPLPGTSGLVAERDTGASAAKPASKPKADDASAPRDAPPALADRAKPASSPSQAAAAPSQPRQAAARPAAAARAEPQQAAARPPAVAPSALAPDAEGTAHIRQAKPAHATEGVAVAGQSESRTVPARPAMAEAVSPAKSREAPAATPVETRVAREAQRSPADRTTVARATPATTPSLLATLQAGSAARPAAKSKAATSEAPAAQAKAAAQLAMAAQEELVITFATNSSYFPPGTSKRLRSLVRGLAAGERYRVVLKGGVSASDKVVGASTPDEARQYNRWLAERRVERVRSWLDEHAPGTDLVIEPQYEFGNEERTVVVQIAPTA